MKNKKWFYVLSAVVLMIIVIFLFKSCGEQNSIPVINKITNVDNQVAVVDEGKELSLKIEASDKDGDSLTYVLIGEVGSEFEQEENQFTWAPDYDQAGEYDLVLQVSDQERTIEEEITVRVNNVDREPEISILGTTTGQTGEKINFEVEVIDPDDDAISLEIGNLPAGSNFNRSKAEFEWVPNYDQVGSYELNFIAKANGKEVKEVVEVNVKPTEKVKKKEEDKEVKKKEEDGSLEIIGNNKVKEGENLNFRINAKNINTDDIEYAVDNLPQGAEFNQETGEFIWMPSYKDAGRYPVKFYVQSEGEVIAKEVAIKVENIDRLPQIEVIESETKEEVQQIKLDEAKKINLKLKASDPDGDKVQLSATNLPQGASFDQQTGELEWETDYKDAGEYQLAFKAEANGLVSEAKVEIKVNDVDRKPVINVPEKLEVREKDSLSFTIEANDPDGDEIDLSVDNLPEGAVFNQDTGEVEWTPNYEQAGAYHLEVIAEANNKEEKETIEIEVINKDRKASIDLKEELEVDEGEEIEFTVKAEDPDGDKVSLSSLDLPKGAEFDAATGEFSWQPNYEQAGSYQLEFEAESRNKTVSKQTKIIVNNVDRAPIIDIPELGEVKTDKLLSFTVKANDPDGDEVDLEAEGLPPGASFNRDTGEFKWLPRPEDIGVYKVVFEVTANDKQTSKTVAIPLRTVEGYAGISFNNYADIDQSGLGIIGGMRQWRGKILDGPYALGVELDYLSYNQKTDIIYVYKENGQTQQTVKSERSIDTIALGLLGSFNYDIKQKLKWDILSSTKRVFVYNGLGVYYLDAEEEIIDKDTGDVLGTSNVDQGTKLGFKSGLAIKFNLQEDIDFNARLGYRGLDYFNGFEFGSNLEKKF